MVRYSPEASAGTRSRRGSTSYRRAPWTGVSLLPHAAELLARVIRDSAPVPRFGASADAIRYLEGRLRQYWGADAAFEDAYSAVAEERNRLEEQKRFFDRRDEVTASLSPLVDGSPDADRRMHSPGVRAAAADVAADGAAIYDFFHRIVDSSDGNDVAPLMVLGNRLKVSRNALAKQFVRESQPIDAVSEALTFLVEDWKTVLDFDAVAYRRVLATHALNQRDELERLFANETDPARLALVNEVKKQHEKAIELALEVTQEMVLLAAEQSTLSAHDARNFFKASLQPTYDALTVGVRAPIQRSRYRNVDANAVQRAFAELSDVERRAVSALDTWVKDVVVPDVEPPPMSFEIGGGARVPGRSGKTAVIVYPHADDEVTFAPLIKKLTSEGVRVVLVVATDGAGGTVQNPKVDRPSLHALIPKGRIFEQLVAALRLGVSRVVFARKGDSGMKKWPSRGRFQLHTGEVIKVHPGLLANLAEIIDQEKPDIVFTGQRETDSYNHPDHETVPLTVEAAVEHARDNGHPDLGFAQLSMCREKLDPILSAMDDYQKQFEAEGFTIRPELVQDTSGERPTHSVTCDTEHVRDAGVAAAAHVSQLHHEMLVPLWWADAPGWQTVHLVAEGDSAQVLDDFLVNGEPVFSRTAGPAQGAEHTAARDMVMV